MRLNILCLPLLINACWLQCQICSHGELDCCLEFFFGSKQLVIQGHFSGPVFLRPSISIFLWPIGTHATTPPQVQTTYWICDNPPTLCMNPTGTHAIAVRHLKLKQSAETMAAQQCHAWELKEKHWKIYPKLWVSQFSLVLPLVWHSSGQSREGSQD